MNAAETWVDIYQDELMIEGERFIDEGSYVDFVAESGKLEFFLFGSSQSPKTVSHMLTNIIGYPTLPPLFSLGFHYSKWE